MAGVPELILAASCDRRRGGDVKDQRNRSAMKVTRHVAWKLMYEVSVCLACISYTGITHIVGGAPQS